MSNARAAGFVAAGLLVLLYGTPLRGLWANGALPWWSPFLAWSLVIGAIALGGRRS